MLGFFGMGLSASHLGRGERSWRAALHLKSSWLSREIFLVGGRGELTDRARRAAEARPDEPMVQELAEFLMAESARSFVLPPRV